MTYARVLDEGVPPEHLLVSMEILRSKDGRDAEEAPGLPPIP